MSPQLSQVYWCFYLCVCVGLAIIQHEGFFLHPYRLLASITSQTCLLMRTFLYICSHAFICVASGNYQLVRKINLVNCIYNPWMRLAKLMVNLNWQCVNLTV